MIMPFIRLISIYVLVALVVLGVFNRDGLKQMLGIAGDGTAFAQSDDSLPPVPAAASATTTAAAAAKPVEDVTTENNAGSQAVSPQNSATPATTSDLADDAAPANTTTSLAPTSTLPEPNATSPALAPPIAEPTDDNGVTQRLNAARAAYWKGDSTTAEALYKALIADFPERVDLAGELGNIYYSSGRSSQAAPYYERVARALLASGQTANAQSILSVLDAIAPDLAKSVRDSGKQTN